MDAKYVSPMQLPTTVLEAANTYLARNWRVLPVLFQSKKCTVKDWPNYQADDYNLKQVFAHPSNVGVVLDKSGLTDIDIDSPDALPFAHWLPASCASTTWTPSFPGLPMPWRSLPLVPRSSAASCMRPIPWSSTNHAVLSSSRRAILRAFCGTTLLTGCS